MNSVNKKRLRILSSGSDDDDSDDVDQGNPKTHENGGKRRTLWENKEGETENGVKSNTCVVCNGKDNWVLICYGEQCPVAIHQSCTSDEPDFDEFGNFYCPYCWYKRVAVKCVKLQKKLMVIETEDIENVVEVNVSGSRRIASVNSSGDIRECGGLNDECIVMEKTSQKMKEVAAKTHAWESSKADGTELDTGRQQRGRFNDKYHETSDAFISRVQVHDSDVGRKRKPQREKRRYSEKNQQNEAVAGTHEQDVFINDGGTQVRDSDLGEGTSGKGYCHETNQHKKVSSTERREQQVPRTDKEVLHGSALGEGRHIKNNHHTKTAVTETQEKEVYKDRKRKREGGDELYFAENQDRHCQTRNDEVGFSEQEKGFSKDEHVEQNTVSSISSPESTDSVNESNAASQELALIVYPLPDVHAQPIEAQPLRSVPSKKSSFQPDNDGHKSYLERNGTASNDPEQRKFDFCTQRKRKRLFWSQAEEEMLRVGVQKFPGGRNIPWRKILEFGRDVFHNERVPSDLKDKWKTMNKVTFTGKWVSLSTERQPNYYVSEVVSE